MRAARRALPPGERRRKSLAIAERLAALPAFQAAESLGLYAALPEEVDTAPLIQISQQAGKALWLPVVNTSAWRAPPLLFRPYVPGATVLRRNGYGIPEPAGRKGAGIPGSQLHLVIAPLVAFNEECERIGMGKGYYDRAFPKRRQGHCRARLAGIAFECQKADFAAGPHDRPMDWIVTEARVYARHA